ncbi:general secretion pathway protein GspB [Aliagarivorans marinus]|uniref:general secretion pathway protein GspB n=1 Tax=Aliagarivorans marinus TaxID=561965 RepID=UPI00040A07AF|nr:general secretion pathway protein GspB [Aliagarivorans marinus]
MSIISKAQQRGQGEYYGGDKQGLSIKPLAAVIGGIVLGGGLAAGAYLYWSTTTASPSLAVTSAAGQQPVVQMAQAVQSVQADQPMQPSPAKPAPAKEPRAMENALTPSEITILPLPELKLEAVDLLSLRQQQLKLQSEAQAASYPQAEAPVSQAATNAEPVSQITPNAQQTQPLAQQAEPEVDSVLAALFADAVEATEGQSWQQGDYDMTPQLSALDEAISAKVPDFKFNSHVYSSDSERSYVRFNNELLYEGEEVAPGVILEAIRRDDVILNIDGTLCRQRALKDWKLG